MKFEFPRQIFESLNINSHHSPSSGSKIIARGQTDRQIYVTKLVVTFRNFANAPN